MLRMNIDLRKYLQHNHNQLTWKERIEIAYDIIAALIYIHEEDAIHRDLHSGNILHSTMSYQWYISDLGFCGPADKPLNTIYGNLPYIAPEVIAGKGYTKASDVYSIGMLMWEISSGQPPFFNYENKNDYDFAMKIVNGMRPKIAPETPLKYKELMKQCWDASPLKRPDIRTLYNIIEKINRYYHSINEEQLTNNIKMQLDINVNTSSNIFDSLVKKFNSKVYIFEGFPEPKKATEGKLINNTFYYLLYHYFK